MPSVDGFGGPSRWEKVHAFRDLINLFTEGLLGVPDIRDHGPPRGSGRSSPGSACRSYIKICITFFFKELRLQLPTHQGYTRSGRCFFEVTV